VRVEVIGHTDSRGSDEVNKPLSINRADAVRDYLTARGVASSRISIDGRGESQPVASNDTAEGRAQNRRVEIFLADKGQTQTR
jgi:outer membrane protein OmpA-like peptidoglycan-associated protein